jgi:hypothetical protein
MTLNTYECIITALLYWLHVRHPQQNPLKQTTPPQPIHFPMGSNSPLSASITAMMPAMSAPVVQAQQLSFPSAIGSEGEDTLPLNVTSFTVNSPHTLSKDAIAFVLGSVRIQKIGNDFMGTVDATSVNTILPADHITSLDPNNNSTPTFQLTGLVTSVAPCSFTIETGHCSFEVQLHCLLHTFLCLLMLTHHAP